MLRLLLFALLLMPSHAMAATWQQQLVEQLGNGTVFVEDARGQPVFAHRAMEHFTPASTLKLATSACALATLPKDFRFRTAFYQDAEGNLYVKGFGDPSLVSEEMARIAATMAQRGVKRVQHIFLDDAFFASNIRLDGQALSLNPYDALNGALLVNYNTINVRVGADGSVASAEPQTPMTALTKQLAKGLKPGKQRINLSRTPTEAVLYVGHLLKAFLMQQGIPVSGGIQKGGVPRDLKPLYVHTSSKTIEDNLRDLLDFSNNFIANQLFLFMGAKEGMPPATAAKGRAALTDCLQKKFRWNDFTVEEGSGLSRKNRVTAAHLMGLLRWFESYQPLLPLKEHVFRAKTGTLTGVSALAGYFTTPAGTSYRFVIIQNDPQKASFHSKFRLAKLMYHGIAGQ